MKKRHFAVFFILFLMSAVIAFPERYLPSVTRGIVLFWTAVLPALFPFFFFNKLLAGLGFPEDMTRLFEKPVKRLFKTPPVSAYVFFMSTLSGYPVGAKLISEFYKNNLLNTAECKKITSFCSTSAPLFVIGTVGTYMLNDALFGALILVSHYLSAIFTGLVFCNVSPLKSCDSRTTSKPLLPDNLIGDSINNAVFSVLSVGGLMAVFSLIIDVFSDLNLFNIFGKDTSALLIGLVEITRGISEVIKNPPNTPLLLAVVTGLISFGGLCIFLQSMTFLSEAKIKASYFFAVKAFQGLSGGIIAYALGLLAV